jgi:hypothetical protein
MSRLMLSQVFKRPFKVATASKETLEGKALVVDGRLWRRSAVSIPDLSWVVVVIF